MYCARKATYLNSPNLSARYSSMYWPGMPQWIVKPTTGLARFVRLTSSINVVSVTLRKREAIKRACMASPVMG
jgi:hypothetical protein